MIEDKLLIWRFKCGSAGALCRIYKKYKNNLLKLATALLNETTVAEDVVQDVFVSFAQSAEKNSVAISKAIWQPVSLIVSAIGTVQESIRKLPTQMKLN